MPSQFLTNGEKIYNLWRFSDDPLWFDLSLTQQEKWGYLALQLFEKKRQNDD
jgi:hypothetical protein